MDRYGIQGWGGRNGLSVLGETDSSGLFTETLTAEIEAVLANETSLVGAEAALAATLSEFPGTREPNVVVRHFGCCWVLER